MSNATIRADAESEIGTARRILQLEREVARLLSAIPAAQEGAVLTPGRRIGTTRAAAVDRLEASITAAAIDPRPDPVAVRAAQVGWQEAQSLRWRLAMSAVGVAHREARRLSGNTSVSRGDLIQEGMLGLLRAAKRFEPELGIRFATYARWWVRASMTRAIDQSRVVRLSASAGEQLRNLRKEIRVHETVGATWSVAGVAAATGLETERARTLLGIGTGRSLDDPGDNDGRALASELVDPEAGPVDDAVGLRRDLDRLRGMLATALPDLARRILQRRYGIDEDQLGLGEVAALVGLSRSQVRRTERESMVLLRKAWAAPAAASREGTADLPLD